MTDEASKVRREDEVAVATITLADPERRNVLSAELITDLVVTLRAAIADPAVRVIVLTNDGTTFCAGADLAERATIDDAAAVPDLADLFSLLHSSPTPIVGRIAGHAVAGGLGLAAACDISIAIDTARMGFSEVRLGLAPAVISVVCLPKMRPAEAAEAFLRGTRFDAVEGARLGLVNRAVSEAELDAAVDEVVSDLLLGGPEALTACKDLLARIPTMAPADAFGWASARSAELFTSDEGREGMAAYLAKRPPAWAPEA